MSKQLLTYISPNKEFNEEHKMTVKIQIDNSIRLGWNREDIILATNFEYEYNGVTARILSDDNYCQHHFYTTKIYVIVELFKLGLINDLYWYHDSDCFQLNPFDNIEKDMGTSYMGLTNYGRMPRLCSASMFIRPESKEFFITLKERIDNNKEGEEEGIARLINSTPEFKEKVKLLNLTYAFQKWNMWHSYCRSEKPIKAVHFHLTPDKYDFFVNGNNRVNLKIIPTGLVDIFHKHGFKY